MVNCNSALEVCIGWGPLSNQFITCIEICNHKLDTAHFPHHTLVLFKKIDVCDMLPRGRTESKPHGGLAKECINAEYFRVERSIFVMCK